MSERLAPYDIVRSFAILAVFIGHILAGQLNNAGLLLAVATLSPGLTMSLLGFISAVLVSPQLRDPGVFLLRRLIRIYVSMLVCLFFVLMLHWFLGKKILTQHTLLHLMGLSAFFELLGVPNKSTIGAGLWFITVIITMYLFLPSLVVLFRHKNGLAHCFVVIITCTLLDLVMYGTESAWNVVISFCLGVFLSVNGYINRIVESKRLIQPAIFSLVLLAVCAFATAQIIPHATRSLLFAFYPLAFVPLFFSLSAFLPPPLIVFASLFSSLSYEFYILHFYFINEHFYELFPASWGLLYHIALSFVIILSLSYVLSRAAQRICSVANKYFGTNERRSVALP